MLRALIAIVLIACLSPPALAQRTNGTAAAPSVSTGKFIREATAGNRFEINSSQLALTRSLSPRVRDFARQMIRDHRQSDRQLRQTLRTAGLKKPNGLDARSMRVLAELRAARGRAFERSYIDAQVDAHVRAVDLFRNYSRSGQNRQLKQFADETLPILKEHLRSVQHLEARVAERR